MAILGAIYFYWVIFTKHIYLMSLYKPDLALNILKLLISHKTKPNQTISNDIYLEGKERTKLRKIIAYR